MAASIYGTFLHKTPSKGLNALHSLSLLIFATSWGVIILPIFTDKNYEYQLLKSVVLSNTARK